MRRASVFILLSLIAALFGACGNDEAPVGAPDRHALGPSDAAVTLLAFDDYQ